jgi:hypothetical protein
MAGLHHGGWYPAAWRVDDGELFSVTVDAQMMAVEVKDGYLRDERKVTPPMTLVVNWPALLKKYEISAIIVDRRNC